MPDWLSACRDDGDDFGSGLLRTGTVPIFNGAICQGLFESTPAFRGAVDRWKRGGVIYSRTTIDIFRLTLLLLSLGFDGDT